MMNRTKLTLFLTFAAATGLHAQSTLSGRLVEQSSGRPMYCWSVFLLDSAGVPRDSTVTWRGGLFEFTIPDSSVFRVRVRDLNLTDVVTPPERTGVGAYFSREYRIGLFPDSSLFTTEYKGDPTSPIGPEPGTPGPIYPEELRQAGIEGSVHYTFTIDTLGRIDTASAIPLRATHPMFAGAVLQSFPRMRFRRWSPTGTETCARVIQPFVFRLQR